MSNLLNLLSQCFFIKSPALTEKNLPSQSGRVFVVTGGYAGCGLELSKMLYSAHGTVYIAGRSASKGANAVSTIKAAYPNSRGKVEFIPVDLADLKTVKPAAEAFLAKESRLDVLTNNAGVMFPPEGSVDAQGYELQIGTNCLGSFLLTKLLYPTIQKTAAISPAGSVRVTWAGSIVVDMLSPKPGGMVMNEKGRPQTLGVNPDYGQSKVGNLYFASEYAKRFGKDDGVVHVCWNPGNLRSELTRHLPWFKVMSVYLLMHPPLYGAYTELWAGWSEDVTPAHQGRYIVPWGQWGRYRDDVAAALKSKAEGGTGQAEKFWKWCEGVTQQYE